MPIELHTLTEKVKMFGREGASIAELRKNFGRGKLAPSQQDVLDSLNGAVKAGLLIGPIKVPRTERYFHSSFPPPVATAPKPKKNSLLTLSELEGLIEKSGTDLFPLKNQRLSKGVQKNDLDEWLQLLVYEKKIIKLKAGRNYFYFHRRVAETHFGMDQRLVVLAEPKIQELDPATVISLYKRIKSEQKGIDTVLVAHLLEKLHCSKKSLHDVLLIEAKRGRANLYPSNTVNLSPEVLEAAIRVEGHSEPLVSVVFKETL